ncbi:uncharacterized protein LOC127365372 isoform X4 [Dicentrarchus labrax]|uniref:uncharacterized protein LOC127365372 isoform X4 n=1 Tax=Dicentrarchus labrax TaxID=13489 RepID=UPI0021F5CFB9|nr:uncharacterized protein LOC127365372 isoform X4 [Dicentrarchus labrax]
MMIHILSNAHSCPNPPFYFGGGTDSAQGQPTSSGAAKADESGPSLSSAPSTVPTVLSVTSAVPGPSLSSAPSTVPTVPSVSHTTSAVPGPSSLVIEIDVSSSASSLEQGSAAPPVDPAECPCFLSDSERTEQRAAFHYSWQMKAEELCIESTH